MTWTLEVMFAGLCLFKFQRDEQGNVEAGEVLMVDATHLPAEFWQIDEQYRPDIHRPRLVVDGRNLIDHPVDPTTGLGPRQPDETSVGPDGRDYGQFHLERENLALSPVGSPPLEVFDGWDADGTAPEEPGPGAPEEWFDWAPNLAVLDQRVTGLISSDSLEPGLGRVITRIAFERGWLKTYQTGRDPVSDDPIVQDFRSLDDLVNTHPQSGYQPRAMADRILLSVEDIPVDETVEITTARGTIHIGLADPQNPGTVNIAFTNLCTGRPVPRQPVASDVLWYWNLVEWTGDPPVVGDRILPVPIDGVGMTPSTGLCPPLRFEPTEGGA